MSPRAALAAVFWWVAVASAQDAGAPLRLSPADLAAAMAGCEQLGRMPAPPISVEACKAMLGMASGLQSAADDPSAHRPGDETMHCDAIFAELKTLAGVGLSSASRAKAEAVVARGAALAERQGAETGAFLAESMVLGAAAGALGAFTPNFVGAALAAVWQAQAVALGTRHAAEQAPLRAAASDAMLVSASELTETMHANPRFARLGQLGAARQCEPPTP